MTIAEKFYVITGEPAEGEIENLIFGLDNLSIEQQKQIEDLLKEHLSFSKVEWMELPAQVIRNSKGEEVAVVAKTRKIDNEPTEDKSDKTLYLYKILYSPVIYDPIDLQKPVKDSMIISPLLYNPVTFEPGRKIVIEWIPADLYDRQEEIHSITWEDEKIYLREKLEELLANPDHYKPKGRRALMVRFALDKTEE
jgi:hypothetical protein